MTVETKGIELLRSLMGTLVQGHFEQVEHDGRSGRLSAHALQEALHAYGRMLTILPNEAFRLAGVYPVMGQYTTWAVDVPSRRFLLRTRDTA